MVKEAKLIKIGNSLGIRLPKRMISRYGLGGHVVLQEVEGGILIQAVGNGKLSWEETYEAIAREESGDRDDWQGLDTDLDHHL